MISQEPFLYSVRTLSLLYTHQVTKAIAEQMFTVDVSDTTLAVHQTGQVYYYNSHIKGDANVNLGVRPASRAQCVNRNTTTSCSGEGRPCHDQTHKMKQMKSF